MSDLNVALSSIDNLIDLLGLLDYDTAAALVEAPAVQGTVKRSILMDTVHRLGERRRIGVTTTLIDDVVAVVEAADEYDDEISEWIIAKFRLIDAVIGLVARDLIPTSSYQALTDPVSSVLGQLHPDDPEVTK